TKSPTNGIIVLNPTVVIYLRSLPLYFSLHSLHVQILSRTQNKGQAIPFETNKKKGFQIVLVLFYCKEMLIG
ncbi:MAG: hypothetical protein WBZ36_01185, partial [Candidatus Nitrosopolaris sp.]